jgi:hypothetical protein
MNTTAGMTLRGRLIAWLLLVALLICCLSGLLCTINVTACCRIERIKPVTLSSLQWDYQ